MKIYIGYDPRDHAAYKVAEQSIRENTRANDLEFFALKEWELRHKGVYWRSYHTDRKGQMWDDVDGKPFSTQFSFTRFCVPELAGHCDEWVLFMDADMMFRADITELLAQADDKYAVMCVQHNHDPEEKHKMDGVLQTRYKRKNWSSFMLMNPSKCRDLTRYKVNSATGQFLHGLIWLRDEEIGQLDPRWNFLAGYDDPSKDPKNVHFTNGTPDMHMATPTPWDGDWWDCLDRARKGL